MGALTSWTALTASVAGLRWRIGHAWRLLRLRWGRDGVLLAAALALLPLAVAGWMAAERFADRERQRLVQHLAAFPAPSPASQARPDGPAQRLAAFDAALLPRDSLPDALDALLALARETGVTLARADFHPQADAAGGFLRYRMNMPVAGSGPAIGRFMREALQRHPALVFEGVQFERESIGAAAVQASIRWAFLMSPAPTPPPRERRLPADQDTQAAPAPGGGEDEGEGGR